MQTRTILFRTLCLDKLSQKFDDWTSNTAASPVHSTIISGSSSAHFGPENALSSSLCHLHTVLSTSVRFVTRRARKYHAGRFVTSCLLLQKKLCSSFIRQDQRLSCENFKTLAFETLPEHSAHCLPTHTTKASFKAFTDLHALAESSPSPLLPLVSNNCQQPYVCTKI